MNTPNFQITWLAAQERHRDILREAQRTQLLLTMHAERTPLWNKLWEGVNAYLRNRSYSLLASSARRAVRKTPARSFSV